MADEKKSRDLAKTGDRRLARQAKKLTVGTLEEALLKAFPVDDAEGWDRTGLTVGERAVPVESAAIALDPTVRAIEQARDIGANVLITHHPLFLDAPDSFSPEPSVALSSGAGVWAAIRNQVAVMSFHTALDVSQQAQRVLPSMLGFKYKGKVLEPLEGKPKKGYGQLCDVPRSGSRAQTLKQVAARAVSVFGRMPRVWGDMESPVRAAVTVTGSAGNIGKLALDAGADCLIAGEVKYHAALELSQAGLSIIELGHDVSELPLTAVLAEAAVRAGLSQESITILDQSHNWEYPEAIRV